MTRVRCFSVLFFVLICGSAARAELRLWCEFGGKRLSVAGVEGREIFCNDGQTKVPVPRDAHWVVEGDLISNADSVVWCPTYLMIRRDVPEWQRDREAKPYWAVVSVAHVTMGGGRTSQSEVIHYWPKGVPQPAIMILAWVLDRKIVYTAGQSIPSTKEPMFVAEHQFDLTAPESAGQAVVLLWENGHFVAPGPRFTTTAAQRAFYAVLLNDVPALQHALDGGVKPGEATRSRISLLHYAAASGADDCITELLRRGAPPSASGEYGTALDWAVEKGRARAVELLLAAKAPTNSRLRGWRPLHRAISDGQEAIALQLVRAGADLDEPNWRSLSAVGQAVDSGMISVVTAALERKAEIDFKNEQLARVLIAQAGLGSTRVVNFLLEHHVAPDVENHNLTPLMAGAKCGDPLIAQALLAKGANPNHHAANGLTPLMVAAASRHLEYAQALIAGGAHVDEITPSGTTALHICAGTNAADLATLLIKSGASTSLSAKDSGTPLEMALSLQSGEVARLLAAAGAKLPLSSPAFATNIVRALELDLGSVITAAVADGWSPNTKLEGGWPALRVAQFCGAKECVRVLQAAGAVVDSTMPALVASTEIDSAPRPVQVVAPNDPRDEEEAYPKVRVAVEALIDRDGSVRFPHLQTKAAPALGAVATATVEQWKFKPATRQGQPVAVKVTLPIVFPASDERIRDLSDVDEMPKPVEQRMPVYPIELRDEGFGGAVVVHCVVTTEGHLERLKVISSSHPLFSEAVLKVMSQWVFKPAQRDGKPVPVHMAIPVAFSSDE